MQPLPSTKPYLLRAIWEWCCDNGYTPYIAVVVDQRTRVPREFVRDGQIVLNLGPDATAKLQMGNDFVDFQARFGGVARDLSIPLSQIAAIYARENGAGMAFEIDPKEASSSGGDETEEEAEETPPADPTRLEGGRPKLQRIK